MGQFGKGWERRWLAGIARLSLVGLLVLSASELCSSIPRLEALERLRPAVSEAKELHPNSDLQPLDAPCAEESCADWTRNSAPERFAQMRTRDRRAAWRLALHLAETLGQASEPEALRGLDGLTASHSSLFVPALYFRLPRELRQPRLDHGYLTALKRSRSGFLDEEQRALTQPGQLSAEVMRQLVDWLGSGDEHLVKVAERGLLYDEDLFSSSPTEPIPEASAIPLEDLLHSSQAYRAWVGYADRGLVDFPRNQLRQAVTAGIPEAVEALEGIEGAWSVQLLNLAAEHPNSEMRMTAARVAWGRGGPTAIASLQSLAGDEDPDVRLEAAGAYGSARTPEAVAVLVRLAQDSSTRVREVALRGLEDSGQFVPPSTALTEALLANLEHGSIETRLGAIRAAASIHRSELTQVLVMGILDPSPKVVQATLRGLMDYAAAGLVDQPPPTRLRELLEDPELSWTTARLLSTLGDKSSRQMLLDCLETCSAQESVRDAALGLDRFQDPELEAPLVKLLEKASDRRAAQAVLTLQEIAVGPGIEAVAKRMNSPSVDLAGASIEAAETIALRGFESAVREPLFVAADDPRSKVRAAAAGALSAVHWPRPRQRLLALLRDPEWEVRVAAAAALALRGESAAEPVACEALKTLAATAESDFEEGSSWRENSRRVFETLKLLETPECANDLLDLLEHPFREVRSQALDTILHLGISMSEERWLTFLEASPDSFGFRSTNYQILASAAPTATLLDQLLGDGPSCNRSAPGEDDRERWRTTERLVRVLNEQGRSVAFDDLVERLGADSTCVAYQLRELAPWIDLSKRPGATDYLYGDSGSLVASTAPEAGIELLRRAQRDDGSFQVFDALLAWRPTDLSGFTGDDLVQLCESEYYVPCRGLIEAVLKPVIPPENVIELQQEDFQAIAAYLETGDGEALRAGDLLELFAHTRVLGFLHAATERPAAEKDIQRFEAAVASQDPALQAAGHYLIAQRYLRSEAWRQATQHGTAAAANAHQAKLWSLEAVSLLTVVESAFEDQLFDDAAAAAEKALVAASLAQNPSDFRRLYPVEARLWQGLALRGRDLPDDRTQVTADLELAISMAEYEQAYSNGGWKTQEGQRLEVLARSFLGEALVERGRGELEEAVDLGRGVVATSRIDEQAENARYLGLARQRLGDGDVDKAQELLEELALRRARDRVDLQRLRLADPERDAALAEYQSIEEQIAQLEVAAERASAAAQSSQESAAPDTDNQEALRLQRELAAKRRELHRYVNGLQQSHPELAALLGARPTDLATLLDELPSDTLAVQYLLLPQRLVLFVLGGQQLEALEVPAEPQRLAADVAAQTAPVKARLQRKMVAGFPSDPEPAELERLTAEAQAAAARLAEVLLDPLLEAGFLNGVETLIVLPSGALHGVSFASLPLAEEDLIDRYRLVYASSTSMLQFARSLQSTETWSPASMLSLGDPDGSLPGAAREAQTVTALVGGPPALIGAQATHEAFSTGLGAGPEVVHLATHANANRQSPQRSSLLLADGELEVDEVWGLPMDRVRLTTLSACETGVGTLYSGDDLVSLETAFLYAGSESVLATRWKVDDRVTEKLMTTFYTELAGGTSAAQALRRAQQEIRDRYPDEYYWAGFTFHGAWW